MNTVDDKVHALLRQLADPRTPDTRAAMADFALTARELLKELDASAAPVPAKCIASGAGKAQAWECEEPDGSLGEVARAAVRREP